MGKADCDLSPLKQQVELELNQVLLEIETSLATMKDENSCVLGNLEKIRERFVRIESTAASFYLYCYLSPYTDTYSDLSVAIQHLSRRRHGALIVIQRNDPLGHLVQNGTMIGASLSSSLLESIFYPGGPLHDGAVLVQGNTIVSARNVLPLATSFLGDPNLGTRHRAAVGLSERSDALVIVVSEETGKARFAIRGRLYPLASV
ncbi:MAG: sporulation-specific diadenylate cyclase CdaS [Clostridia bacterium]